MLTVHHSNRLEALLLGLAEVIARPLPDPFAPEEIVVQHAGMARWLAQQLAQQRGVAANLAFPLPASFIWRMFRAWLPDLPQHSAFAREALAWQVYGQLPARLHEPAFAPLGRYLAGDSPAGGPPALKRWQLAARIADVFDQYLVYRPDLVLAWEAPAVASGSAAEASAVASSGFGVGFDAGFGADDADAAWQAALWRDLVARIDSPHRARLLARMQATYDADLSPLAPALLPTRVALFGLTALPPADCRLLQLLARHCEVHLFLLNPCAEYWADIDDPRRQTRQRRRALTSGAPDPGALLDLGNPLLAAFGHTGQAFLDQVLELDGEAEEAFFAPTGNRLLARLQRDVLTLADPRPPPPPAITPARKPGATAAERADTDGARWLDPTDDSLLIHRCHGPLREVQVLHDRLLALIAASDRVGGPALEPRDILVMAPDIDRYAPFIDAVFGAAPPARYLPWSIADRTPGSEQPVLAACRDLLALPLSRLTAAEVLGWLGVPAIARRFGLDDAGLARIRTWAAETGIRWGLDAAMRAGLDLPVEDANTWAFGLRRLFLGLVLPLPGFTTGTDGGDDPAPVAPDLLFHGTMPYPDLDSGDAMILGGLQSAIDRLGHWRDLLARPRPAAAWRRLLQDLLDDLFDPDEDEEAQLQRLREGIEDLARHSAGAGVTEALPPELVRTLLGEVIDAGGGSQRFLTGRVTFCNMVPMRSIPARIIALLGMNGSDFPRRQRPPGFDLIARRPRRGDRSRRGDDRYLFLEALLSAREHLHLSYSGRDPRDNALKVPSVVIDELLAAIDRGHADPPVASGAPSRAPSTRIVIDHPLQPFSPHAFAADDPLRWSFAAEWLARPTPAGTGSARAAPDSETPFAGVLPDPGPLAVIELDDLTRFLRHPARWFLQQRLRLRLPGEAAVIAEQEPFVLDGLARWDLRQRLLAIGPASGPATGLAPGDVNGDEAPGGDAVDPVGLTLLRAAGLLPHGAPGDIAWSAQAARVAAFQAALATAAAPRRPRVELDLDLGPALPRLTGWLDGLTADGLLDHRLGRCRGADLLVCWLRHLLLNAVAPADCARRSAFLSDETKDGPTWIRLGAVTDPLPELRRLAGLFVAARRAPVLLYPESGWEWARTGDPAKVQKVWDDAYQGPPGEGSDAAIELVTRGQPDPLGDGFRAVAAAVFGPLLAAIDDGAGG